ncbi:MAG: aminopeptidase [Haloquadratum sp.]|nr:aminopeptidase [Haloquadratum sp.]
MDPRIRAHAEIIADHSAAISAGDAVVIVAPAAAADLTRALYEACADRGATPVSMSSDPRTTRAFLRGWDGAFETPEHLHALYREMDVFIAVRGDANATELADVPPEVTAAYRRAMRPVLETRLSKRWTLTQHPTPGSAQLAEMSTEAYENFVWDAVSLDWDAQHERQAQVVELLDAGEEVQIRSGETTALTLQIGGNVARNDTGQHNLPGGEVFTAPLVDGVDGEVHFDLPLYRQGREITGVTLTFRDGAVTDFSAEKHEEVLEGILETDPGARRLGELGIGMNRAIDRFSYNMLFDEKMGDTVHLAVGSAYPDTVGDGNALNESAEHVDMIVDMSTDSSITVDGEVIQRDGRFFFESGFEA